MLGAAGALALPALPAGTSYAAPTASCTASLLAAPAGAPAGAGTRVAKVDDTGKYVVGQVDVGNFDFRPVLWANGVPQLLDAPGEVSDVLDVNSSGTVLGASLDKEGTTWLPWVYSNGTYTMLQVPTWTDGVSANDINDAGVVVGATHNDEGRELGIRWESWDEPGAYVYSRNGNRSYLKEIRGHWTGGDEIYDKPLNTFIGLLWNDSTGARYPLPTEPHSINSTGDAAVTNADGAHQVVTATGTVRWTFPRSTTIRTLMDRRTDPVGTGPDAIGEITDNGTTYAVAWGGCSDVVG
ncbi:hypothetical protein [Kribbella soli]|uniref:HAF family extracellular repeat protein n=1 Tax=Kribbella soli TaxID=1124743 RepID=A0A4R0HHQ7_9ACTN|nr:hypothetical protein [Kribbella soli]TCC07279.1 hypothetical protein E0H45_14810 [Kribbella soli]